MTVKTLYFDESGFTGYNLLDPVQPVFAIASTDIDESSARGILTQSFPRYQAQEFKFTNIWNSSNRTGLLTFASHIAKLADSAFVYVIDKKFGVLTKMVDFLIEPTVTNAGYDFYDEGFCWKYCNYIHYGLTQFSSPELYDALTQHYQAFSRNPSEESLAQLQSQLSVMAASVPEEHVKIFLEQMSQGANRFKQFSNLAAFKGSDELQLTTMVAIISHWRGKTPDDFEVIHDASSNFMRNIDIWKRITNNDVPKQMHRAGDGTLTEFPLRVVATHAVDSKNSSSVQFCDVLAGLTTRHFNPLTQGADRTFIDEVIGSGLSELTYNGIRPQPIFPDRIPPNPLAGPDVVDQMTEIIFGEHNSSK